MLSSLLLLSTGQSLPEPRAGHQSVWYHDQVAGGHAGVGVVSLGGAPLCLPSFLTPQFKEFFRLGRALRTTLPTGRGGVVHLFVVCGYQGAEDDSDQLLLTLRLFWLRLRLFVLVNLCLMPGDLNADPAVIPCLAKGISAGKFVGLALAFSRGAGTALVATCRFDLEVRVRAETFLLAFLTRWLRLMLAFLRTGGLLLTSLYLRAFALMLGWLMLLALWYVNLSGLPVCWILLIGPRLLLVLSRMPGMSIGMSLRWFLMVSFLPLGMRPPGLL